MTGQGLAWDPQGALARAALLLPHQGPIQVFIHRNTLEGLEERSFAEAVEVARRAVGGEPYLAEAAYREALATGRIDDEDVRAALAELPPAQGGPPAGPLALERVRWLLVRDGLDHEPPESREFRDRCGLSPLVFARADPARRAAALSEGARALEARVRAGDLPGACRVLVGSDEPRRSEELLLATCEVQRDLQRLGALAARRPQRVGLEALRTACRLATQGLELTPRPRDEPALTHRGLLLAAGGRDVAQVVDPLLLRLVGAYVDRGQAAWQIPHRLGLFASLRRLLLAPGALARVPWYRGLREALKAAGERPPAELLGEVLADLGVPTAEHERYLQGVLFEAPGYAGLVHWLEHHEPGLGARLVDYVVLRLLFTRSALSWAAAPLGLEQVAPRALREALSARCASPPGADPEPAEALLQLAVLAGAGAATVLAFSAPERAAILGEVGRFDSLERRRVLHRAYELGFQRELLDSLQAHARRAPAPPPAPELQVVTCIDDREESYRRALEELLGARVETFGAAGFFELALRFHGLDEQRAVVLAPAASEPEHDVREGVRAGDDRSHERRLRRRRAWLALALESQSGSRSLARGVLWSVLLGPLATLLLVARVLVPRGSSRLYRWLARALLPTPRTTLQPAGPPGAGAWNVEELADRIETLFAGMGLRGRFAPLVAVLGHGSSSLNNPHESAYDCGACGGYRGGPNARFLAAAANDPEVRRALAARGSPIPEETWVLGGLHDTATDAVTVFDLDLVPARHAAAARAALAALQEAAANHAVERCRRFHSAPLGLGPAAALAHVEGRAVSLAQPRPECGHATNAACVVGRRALTRGLFLDRRAFLTSYDPARDPTGATLTRLLGGVVPVCAGINLEYYFSRVDNERYGCGSKLPHNVTALAGVMNGHLSDLRTGLPWQMVELHEPLRLLVIVEAPPARVAAALTQLPRVARLVAGAWLTLAALDPETHALYRWEQGEFVPYRPSDRQLPRARSSLDYCARTRAPLPPAWIQEPTHAA